MTMVESFFVLAALVVLVGIVVWRRDIRSGRIPRPRRRMPALSLRERLGDTGFRKQTSAAARLSAGARVVDTTTGEARASDAPPRGGSGAADGGRGRGKPD